MLIIEFIGIRYTARGHVFYLVGLNWLILYKKVLTVYAPGLENKYILNPKLSLVNII